MAISEESLRIVSELAEDPRLRNQLGQIGARVTLRSLDRDEEGPQWTYSPSRVIKNVTAMSLGLQRAASTDPSDLRGLQSAARYVAQAWERLGRLDMRVPRRSALLNAALNYDLAGYQANAICLAREVDSRSVDLKPDVYDLASAFLQRRLLYLTKMASVVTREPDESVLEEMSEEALVDLTTEATFAAALKSGAMYFLSGESFHFDESDQYLALVTNSFAEIGDLQRYNLSVALRRLLPVIRERSVWTKLANVVPDNHRWRRYLRVLSRGLGRDLLETHSISELWPSQIRALEAGVLNPDQNLMVRMPTSAGKTRVAELVMVQSLVTQPGNRCIYIAPYRALVAEVEAGFVNLFGDVGYAASTIPGTYEQDSFGELIASTDDLLILTPEKLDLLLRLQPEVLSSVGVVVVDEGHIVGDRTRGPKFELLLTRLRRLLPSTRVLFMSAVVSETTLEQFARWLGAGRGASIVSNWRPAIQRYAKLEWGEGRGTLRFSPEDVEDGGLEFVPNLIRRREFSYVHPATQRRRRPKFPDSKGQVAAELGFLYARQGPVLIFCGTTQWAQSVANEVRVRVELAEATEETVPEAFQIRRSRSLSVAEEWLGADHPVTTLLSRGIAFHHSRLPEAVREAIEHDVRSRDLSVLVATTTLAQGVNLPFRTVIVHSARRFDEESNLSERIPPHEYWNIAGRAGRAAQETEGTIIHIVQSWLDEQDYEFFRARRNIAESLDSGLMRLLRDLVDARISNDEAAFQLDSDLLALLVEEGGDSLDQTQLDETLQSSLFSIQAADEHFPTEPLVSLIRRTTQDIATRIQDPELRRLFASTGLSSSSAALIHDHIQENGERLRELLTTASLGDRGSLAELLLDGTMRVREMSTTAPEIGGVEPAIALWLDGIPVAEMSQELERDPSNVTRYVEDLFAYRLPWGIGAYLRIAAHVLEIQNPSTVVTNFPSMVKYGVPTPEAAWAMTAGVAPRRAAIELARQFLQNHPESSASRFRTWLGDLDPDSLAEDLGLTGPALEATARAIFRAGRNEFLERLDRGESLLPITVSVRPNRRALETGVVAQLMEGTSLDLSRDLDSTINRNAVYVSWDGQRLGYLPWQASQALGPEMDAGLQPSASVEDVSSTEDSTRIRIEISGPP